MKNEKLRWIIIIIIVVAAVLGLYRSGVFSRDSVPIYIVVTVPGKKESPTGTTRSINSIQMYLDKANAEGGVNGHPLRMVVEIDGSDPVRAESVANKIVQKKQAMIVLGNGYSDTATAAGQVFQKNQIPAMTAGATAPSVTEGNDWFFRVTNDNTSQGNYIAEYAATFLCHKTAAIVYENNAYGKSLGLAFEEAFRNHKRKIINVSPIYYKSDTLDQDAKAILASYDEIPDMIFLATYKTSGVSMVMNIREEYPRMAIVGGDDLGDADFATRFSSDSNGKSASDFTDGIYAASPLIFDVASEDAQIFRDRYIEEIGENPTWFTATSYDSALVAVEAMRAAGISGDPAQLEADRKNLRDYLASVNRSDRGFKGITGNIYFDQNHNFTHPMAMGVFESQQFISAPVQFQPVLANEMTEELSEGIANGSIINTTDGYVYKTQIVYVGIDINEFDSVDVDAEHTYLADFYLWFRYKGELDFENIEFGNAVDIISLDEPIEEKQFGDTHYCLYHIRDTFTNAFDLRDYPFDRQLLSINIRHTTLERQNLIFVVDLLGLGNVTTRKTILDGLEQARAFEAVNNWKPVNGYFYADSIHEYTTRGNPAQFGQKVDIEHSRFNAAIEIQRDVIRFTAKTMLPVFCIIVLAYLGFYLPGREFETLTGLMTGTVLSVVFFHVDLSGRLNVGYTVALDYAFYVIYALLATELFISIIAWHRSVKNQADKMIIYLFWLMRILYPVVLIGGVIITMLFYDIAVPGIG